MGNKYDFCGYATRANVKCSDGNVIMAGAFKECCGKTVPLVWNHGHDTPFNVIGHVDLEDLNGDVYCYGYLNDTEVGAQSKALIEHGDVAALSIYANKIKKSGSAVTHGVIREVSLVLAGANPAAYIESISHGDGSSDEIVFYFDEPVEIYHSDGHDDMDDADPEPIEHSGSAEAPKPADKTVGDVLKTLNEEQETVLYGLLGSLLTENQDEENEGDSVKHNVFETETAEDTGAVLSHDAMKAIIEDGKHCDSFKESFIAHADEFGITNIDYLFPDAKTLNTGLEYVQRDTNWVPGVLNRVHRSPFSRVKCVYANITEDDARAKGYIKGKRKKEEVFALLKRTTSPQTIYKKQRFHRDDMIDLVDFQGIVNIKGEMRMMLDEELGRAILIGDGRTAADEDKISEENIRPIWTDDDFFTIKSVITPAANDGEDAIAKKFIRSSLRARKHYKGSGSPVLFTTEDVITACLLLEDGFGHSLYDSVDKLKTKLRVSDIVAVPVMEGATRTVGAKTHTLLGLFVNLNDYNVGADRGGAVSMFDDFDIHYNSQYYLIETRCSGAMARPFSAIAVELEGKLSDYIDDDFDESDAITAFANKGKPSTSTTTPTTPTSPSDNG